MNILIVEDDPQLRVYFAKIIEKCGHSVEVAENGRVALNKITRRIPHMIISDINMPEMDGLQLLSEIRSREIPSVFIIITGLENWLHISKAFELKADNFLKKPIHLDSFRTLLEKYEKVLSAPYPTTEAHLMLTEISETLRLENSLEKVPVVVEHMLTSLAPRLSGQQCLGIRLGLNELIINAIEHGNLGISYQEKTELLTQGVDEYFELLRIRCENPEYQKKFVTIKFHCQSDSARWEIIDAGTGFDWRNLQSPLDELTTGHPHGRGIFLARCQFNTLEFNEEGNKVIATLKF